MPSDEVIYSCPFVPPSLVRAYGLRPRRLIPDLPSPAACRAGVCPFAHDFTQAAMAAPAAGIVFSTLCDQMRRQAEVAAGGKTPVFCLNVPRTWQDAACERYYLDELRRLGRFIERIGGRRPGEGELAKAVADEARGGCHASPLLGEACPAHAEPSGPRQDTSAHFGTEHASLKGREAWHPAVPIALVGGPIAAENWLFGLLAELGLSVALDATETGLAGQPCPGQGGRTIGGSALADPLAELAAIYFAGIHHPSRFPADHLYDWLLPLLARSGAGAIVLRYYAWCDPWHAQAHRLVERSGLGVVEIDGRETPGRARTRLQAIREMAK